MEKISILDPNLLDENDNLYNELLKNPPKWWAQILKDKELYVEIRKENIINVYYQGGSLVQIQFDKRTKHIKTSTHPKYLGLFDDEHRSNTKYYKTPKNERGKIVYEAKYQDCTEWLEKGKLGEMKCNIERFYTQKQNKTDDESEKYIQGDIIINGRDCYLDSEFQHRFYEGKRLSIRIDLIKIEDNHIVFEELKRVKDNRLWTTKGSPEILTQMRNYRLYLKENAEEFKKYYQKLYRIKKKLGLPLPIGDNIDKLVVEIEPRLIIKDYQKPTTQQKNRKENIKDALKKIDIDPVFFNTYADLLRR